MIIVCYTANRALVLFYPISLRPYVTNRTKHPNVFHGIQREVSAEQEYGKITAEDSNVGGWTKKMMT